MLQYPSNLQSTSHPAIKFSSAGGDSIHLPIPASLEFSDSATYDDAELGYRGKKTLNTMQSGGGGLLSRASSFAKGIYDDITGGGIATGLAQNSLIGTEGMKTAVGIATGTALNKNITSEFTGVGTRRFTFAFNMMPYSQSDASMIKGIVFAFRKGIYPDGNDFSLKYPPKWKISFINCGTYIPKIAECYLEDVQTTYNSSTNMWRSDGAPLETTLSVAFKETKALTLKEITELG